MCFAPGETSKSVDVTVPLSTQPLLNTDFTTSLIEGPGADDYWLDIIGRRKPGVTDQQALDAFHETTRLEGIIPALESSHAIAYAMTLAPQLPPDDIVLINLSGRGDKDLDIVRSAAAGV